VQKVLIQEYAEGLVEPLPEAEGFAEFEQDDELEGASGV
jgi:hypothetical protein